MTHFWCQRCLNPRDVWSWLVGQKKRDVRWFHPLRLSHFFFFSRGCEDTSSISYQFIKGPSDVLTREHFRRKLLALNCTCVLSYVHTWGSVFVLYKRVRCRRVSCAKWKQTKKACSEPVNEEELFRDIPHFGKAPESHCGPVTRLSMHSANPPGRV